MNKSVRNGLMFGIIIFAVIAIIVLFIRNKTDKQPSYLNILREGDRQVIINNKYSYKVELPSDWEVREQYIGNFSAYDNLLVDDFCKIETHVLDDTNLSLDEWLEKDKNEAHLFQEIEKYSSEKVLVNNKAFGLINVSGEYGDSIAYVTTLNGKLMQFVFYPIETRVNNCDSDFNSFISSLRFLNE